MKNSLKKSLVGWVERSETQQNMWQACWASLRSTQPTVFIFSLLILMLYWTPTQAAVYQKPAEFIADAFADSPPPPSTLWLRKDLKAEIKAIMGHNWGSLRLRYWQQDNRSAWVLDEIGKERPITVGVIINNDQIERIKILEFRESRGWEVRYPSFTEQFIGATISPQIKLAQNIDGISGATLSVRALKKLARLALFLDRHINNVTH